MLYLEEINMLTTNSILDSIIPVSQFNKGQAGKIFEGLRIKKTKIVVKNNAPIAVIMSPDEYTRLIDEHEDALLLAEAQERMARSTPDSFLTEAQFMSSTGIKEEDLTTTENVEIE